MIYQFKVILYRAEGFQIMIEIDAGQSFLELHKALQCSLGIPPCQMASFFISDVSGRRITEVSEVNMGTGKDSCYFMRRTKISDLVHFNTPVIHYTFDLFNDSSLYLELTGINMEKNLREPKVRINGTDSRIRILEDVITEDYPQVSEQKKISPDYGVTEDYYEIFGDIEELTL